MAVPTWQSVMVVITAAMFGTDLAEVLFAPTGEHHSPQLRMLYLLIYAVFGLLLVSSKDAVRTLVTTAPVLVLVLALPVVSILWSLNPGETMERSVALLGTSLFGAYLGWRFTLGRIIFLLAIAMSIAVCLSMAAIVLAPSIGVKGGGQWAGAWIGTSLHKNALGGTAALSCLLIGYAITDSRGWRRLAFCLALLVSLVLLIGSRSISSLLATAVMGALAFWARHLQRSPKEISVLTLILAIALVTSAIQLVGAGLIEALARASSARTAISPAACRCGRCFGSTSSNASGSGSATRDSGSRARPLSGRSKLSSTSPRSMPTTACSRHG